MSKLNTLRAEVFSMHQALTHHVTEARQFIMGLKRHIQTNPWKDKTHVLTSKIQLENGQAISVPASVAAQWQEILKVEETLNWLDARNKIIEIGREAHNVNLFLPDKTKRYYELFKAPRHAMNTFRNVLVKGDNNAFAR